MLENDTGSDAVKEGEVQVVASRKTKKHGFKLRDHFTMQSTSTTVKLRNNKQVSVVNGSSSQLILETHDEDDKQIAEIRKASTGSLGLHFLRVIYVALALLLTGFVFTFSVELLLYIFLGILSDAGVTSGGEVKVGFAIFAILSLPLFVTALSASMALALGFVADVWNGFQFFHLIGAVRRTASEWIQFSAFLLIPLLTMAFTLIARLDDFWAITLLTSFFCLFAMFSIYALSVLCYEVMISMDIVNLRLGKDATTWRVLKELFFLRLRYSLSIRRSKFFVQTNLVSEEELSMDPEVETSMNVTRRDSQEKDVEASGEKKEKELGEEDQVEGEEEDFQQSNLSWWSRTVMRFAPTWMYRPCNDGVRFYSLPEAMENTPYITYHNWSLESVFCRSITRSSVTVLSGKDAVSRAQLQSSIVCNIIGALLCILLVIAALVFFEISGAIIAFFVVLLLIFFLVPFAYTLTRIMSRYSHSKQNQTDSGAAIYYMWKSYQAMCPTDGLCIFVSIVEAVFFFVVPLAALFASNAVLGVFFLFLGFLSTVRHFCNVRVLLETFGSFTPPPKGMEGSSGEVKDEFNWKKKRVAGLILQRVSKNSFRFGWMIVMTFLALVAFILLVATLNSGGPETFDEPTVLLNDFYVVDSEATLQYPTCHFTDKFALGKQTETGMIDYVFLAYIAYVDPDMTQTTLDQWFGENVAIYQQDLVDQFKVNYTKSPVQYKLITFPQLNSSIVSVRGTSVPIDFFADMQLWMTAFFLQIVRAVLPGGNIWTPILSHLAFYVNVLSTSTLEKVSYYLEVTAFVQWLQDSVGISQIALTGHSLGGGLAIISGSQTQTPTVAISGVNAMISRLTFDPPLTEDELNEWTFNLIPDRDPVPRVDDPALLTQRIACTAPVNEIVGCHTVLRSLCELMYKCGSTSEGANRPALCVCSRSFGYPLPKQTGNRSFEEACPLSSE